MKRLRDNAERKGERVDSWPALFTALPPVCSVCDLTLARREGEREGREGERERGEGGRERGDGGQEEVKHTGETFLFLKEKACQRPTLRGGLGIWENVWVCASAFVCT